MRCAFASWCINPKARDGRELPAKVVQAWMGRSSIKITLDIYGHLFRLRAMTAKLSHQKRRCWVEDYENDLDAHYYRLNGRLSRR